MDIRFDSLSLTVDGVVVQLKGMPLMHCPKCVEYHLPGKTKQIMDYFVQDAHKREMPCVELTPKGVLRKRYPFGQVEFLYSPLDHDFIPGLARPWDDGFLTPVFFRSSVLNKYSQQPDYRLELFSDTYGSIINQADDIRIEFGINRSGKVIMWLGDIAGLSQNEQHYLRSENVESDHDVYSEFYRAQIECEFSDPSLEQRVFRARFDLEQTCQSKTGMELYHLKGEIGRTIEQLRRPVFWEERHVAPAIESLNRIIVESLDVGHLRKEVEPHVAKEQLQKIRGLKLLELWVERCLGSPDAKTIMLPFFVLYDFRVLSCHLCSDESRVELLQSINERLGLEKSNDKFDAVYFALLPKIENSLTIMCQLLAR